MASIAVGMVLLVYGLTYHPGAVEPAIVYGETNAPILSARPETPRPHLERAVYGGQETAYLELIRVAKDGLRTFPAPQNR